jgi:hypothetical protein
MALGRCFDLRQDSELAGFRRKKKPFQQHQLIIDYDQRFTSTSQSNDQMASPFLQIAESEKAQEKSKNETTRSLTFLVVRKWEKSAEN